MYYNFSCLDSKFIFSNKYFFVLGIFNAVSASVYSALLHDNSEEYNLDKILGLSLGIDDVVSIAAPICVTFIIRKGFDGLVFLYANAGVLIITALLGVKINSNKLERESTSTLREIMDETIHNYTFLRESDIGYLFVSECFRSLAEGMVLPLFVIYAANIVEKGQELFTVGNAVMAISQVMMSFIYMYMKRFFKANSIINAGAISISCSLLILFFSSNAYIYCLSMLLLGLGMAIRQLISENMLIAKYGGEKLSKVVAVYNSLISLAYLAGYILSAFQPHIASVKVYLLAGGVFLLIPLGKLEIKKYV